MARSTYTRAPAPGYPTPPDDEQAPPPRRSGGTGWVVPLLVLTIIGLLAWALVATFDDEPSAGPEAGVTLGELQSNSEELTGSRVVVSGEIAEIVGEAEEGVIDARTTRPVGFTIGDDQGVLVLGTNMPQLAALAGDEDLASGDVVQVSGTVHDFELGQIEDELGADLADDAFAEFDDRVSIVASEVHLVPTSARQQGEQLQITATNLLDRPQEFLAQRMTVQDVVVEEQDAILSPRGFALGDDILVIGATGPTNVAPGFRGTVSGTLIEASTARLLNTLNLPTERDMLAELGIAESEVATYDWVLVADQIRSGS